VTLDRHIRTRGRLTPEQALPILRQLGRALGAAHAAGITHRDLKPENVFLTFDEDGNATPKLLDFGIAKLRADSNSTHRTRDGAPMGTPLYMSPEQVYGKAVDHRSDIYSFGILVHEALTGAPPFDGDTVMDVLTAQTSEKPKPVSSMVRELPLELDGPILSMLEKDPDRRPQSITIAVDQLVEAGELSGCLPRRSNPKGAATIPEPLPSTPRRSSLASAATTLAPGEPHPAGSEPPKPSRSRLVLLALGAISVISVVGFVATRGPGNPRAATSPSASPQGGATTSPAVTPSVVVASSEVKPTTTVVPKTPNEVKVTFEGIPTDTEILLDGKKVGVSGDGVSLQKKDDKVKLTLRKVGFAPRDVWIVPDRDRAIATDLIKVRPATHGDLEF
jgi:serine/threonine-protein kinase